MQWAVQRGLQRRGAAPASRRLGVDETSCQKGHEYVTVVADIEGEPRVHHVADGRGREALSSYQESSSEAERSEIEMVAMDMWAAYIFATVSGLPDGDQKLAFDKFHVAAHLGGAVDEVRRAEHRILQGRGDDRLAGTRCLWLYHPDRVPDRSWSCLREPFDGRSKTARWWHLKEVAIMMWETRDHAEARATLEGWYSGAVRSRLEPMTRVARMQNAHLERVLNATEQGVTNAQVEGITSVIRWPKKSARGYRNRIRSRIAIHTSISADSTSGSIHSRSTRNPEEPLRHRAWLIPTLGFIGTVVGISSALGRPGGISADTSDQADVGEWMAGLTRSLAVAFNTTLVALPLSAVLVFLMHVTQGREKSALNQSGQYCLDNLINRLYDR